MGNETKSQDFSHIGPKEIHDIQHYVDERFNYNLTNLPQTLDSMGIKLSQPESRREKVIRALVVVGTVAASVGITLVVQKFLNREVAVETEKEMPGNGSRVRPIGSQRMAAALS